MKAELLQQIRAAGVLPAIRVRTTEQVVRALGLLLQGGIETAEVAMSAEDSAAVLAAGLSHAAGRMTIGAGTVLDAGMARQCIEAGAQFIVTPALDPSVIECCHRYGVPVFMGGLSFTEIEAAWNSGADCVKVFPASAVGGPSYIERIQAMLPEVKLLPMGGVSLDTAKHYIDAGAFALGVGSDLVSERLLAAEPEKIASRGKHYLFCIAEARRERNAATVTVPI